MTTVRRTLDVVTPLPLLLAAQGLGVMGSAAYSVAALWTLKAGGGDDRLLAVAGALFALPALLLGVLAGQLADRVDRKGILVLAPLACAAVLGGVVWLAQGTTVAMTVPLLLAGVLLNVALTFDEPAFLASLPELASEGELGRVNALHQVLTSAGSIGGALLGGVLAGWGVGAAATAGLFAYLLCFLLVPLTRWPARAVVLASSGAPRPNLRELWRLLPPALRQLVVLVCAFITFAAPMPALLPALVHDQLQLGPQALGTLEAAFGGGFVLGGGLALLGVRPRRLAGLGVAVLVAGAVRLGLSVAPTLPVSAGLLLLGGAAVAVASIAAMTQLQEGAPATSRGALLGAVSSLLAGATPLGLGLATAALPTLGLPGILQGTGMVLLLLGLGALLRGRR